MTAEIGIPDPENWEDAEILDEALLASLLPERPRDAHKNTFGHALLIAGNRGMAGAAMLCTNACQRAGVGLTTVCALENSVAPHLQTRLPAAMCVGLEEDAKHTFPPETGRVIRSALSGKTALGCGCGLGRTLDCARPLEAALAAPLPAVIDADGLYHLATRLAQGRVHGYRRAGRTADLQRHRHQRHGDRRQRRCTDGHHHRAAGAGTFRL